MKLDINVSMWFPNTKAKLNQLLKLMEEYDFEGQASGDSDTAQ